MRLETGDTDIASVGQAPRKVIDGLREWLGHCEKMQRAGKRERSTVVKYRSHIEYHIAKTELANVRLSSLAPSDVQKFIEYLERNLSVAMSRKVLQTLRTALKHCRKHEWLSHNPTEDFAIEGRDRENSGRVEIPDKKALAALFKAADENVTGIEAAMVRLLCTCGLRPSELRGLPRSEVYLGSQPPYIRIIQRADIYGVIGKPKSRAGYRKIPIGPETVKALKKAMLATKSGKQNLVFNGVDGKVLGYSMFVNRIWARLMLRAGLATVKTVQYKSIGGKESKKIVTAFDPYTLRHVAASRWIEMNIPPKRIQELMGHSSLKMTMDIYGHLWPSAETDSEIAALTERGFG